MSVGKPYKRTCRPFLDGNYTKDGRSAYITHADYANSPEHYIRAFQVLQKDMLELFDYIEPADRNADTYSFRTHSLFMRTCIEIEANFKAIFIDNGRAQASTNLNMNDYRKLNATHHLSSYEVRLPVWAGANHTRKPFVNWTVANAGIHWYQSYNNAKHARHDNFSDASFGNLIDSLCGLVALLAAQFHTEDFVPGGANIVTNDRVQDGFTTAIGDYFRVKFPTDWQAADSYDFAWAQVLAQGGNPFNSLVL